jgi:type IV pilus assembly protein PilQ
MRSLGAVAVMACLLAGAPAGSLAQGSSSGKEVKVNQLLAISAVKGGEQPVVQITTRESVGYRYTVYDSSDPLRVVIDFPGMDVSAVGSPIKVDSSAVREVRVSSFDLASGRLGRVEILLNAQTAYNVFLSGNDFRVSFTQPAAGAAPVSTALPAKEVGAESKKAESEASAPPATGIVPAAVAVEPPAAVASPAEPATVARKAQSVEVRGKQAVLNTDGRIDRHEQFTLGAPPRLVVDIYGVQPSFTERLFKLSQGFSGIRVGTYPDKTRYVFDAAGKTLPVYTVDKRGSAVVVGWGEKTAQPAVGSNPAAAGSPVTVQAVDFQVKNGKSVLWIALSGPAELLAVEQSGDVVQFGVKNAQISRALRRTIDASAFPSAVRLVTPYPVQSGKRQDVRFAVELKGPVTHSLQQKAGGVEFVVDDGPFAEPAPAPLARVQVPVATPPPADQAPVAAAFKAPTPSTPPATPSSSNSLPEAHKYAGQKISLVFDDAEIRRILQLIAEVSDLNIIVSDDVKGTISLRLIDVPWDQALDLIMEIKGLGMVREGNVVRVLPKDQIRAAAEARLTAARTQEKLEDLVTEAISVSYTNLANVSGAAQGVLTERGKLTEDARNKKLIVKDIPSVVAEIRNLVSMLDTPERQVMIEARIVEADSTFTRDLGVSWAITYNDADSGSGDLSRAAVSGGGNFVISPQAGNAGLGSAITFGRALIDSTVLDLRISALETARQGKVISTPRVSTLNGQAATISQGTKIPYQSSGTDGLPKTEFVDANLQLTVTPEINPDNSIILEINASNSSPTLVSGATQPGISTKEAKTKLLVRDGETTVIGGIFVEDTSDSESGIPYLRKIPYLGMLFKSTQKNNNRSELLIFITPRIVR